MKKCELCSKKFKNNQAKFCDACGGKLHQAEVIKENLPIIQEYVDISSLIYNAIGIALTSGFLSFIGLNYIMPLQSKAIMNADPYFFIPIMIVLLNLMISIGLSKQFYRFCQENPLCSIFIMVSVLIPFGALGYGFTSLILPSKINDNFMGIYSSLFIEKIVPCLLVFSMVWFLNKKLFRNQKNLGYMVLGVALSAVCTLTTIIQSFWALLFGGHIIVSPSRELEIGFNLFLPFVISIFVTLFLEYEFE